jgi:membrane associated rhomboid family serine protease
MTLPTHLIGFALSKIFVDMGASTARNPTNGGGKYIPCFRNQSLTVTYRFITPIFLHAGLIHIALNMLAQLTAAAEVRTRPTIPAN